MLFERAFQLRGVRKRVDMNPVSGGRFRKVRAVVHVQNLVFARFGKLERVPVYFFLRLPGLEFVRQNMVMKLAQDRIGSKNMIEVEFVGVGHEDEPEAAAPKRTDQVADVEVFLKNIVPDFFKLGIRQFFERKMFPQHPVEVVCGHLALVRGSFQPRAFLKKRPHVIRSNAVFRQTFERGREVKRKNDVSEIEPKSFELRGHGIFWQGDIIS